MDRYIFSAELEAMRLRATRQRDRYVTDLGELHAASSFLRVDLDGDEDLRMMVAACDAVIKEIDARRKDFPAFDADLAPIQSALWDAVVGLSDVATHRKRRDAETKRYMRAWEERIAKGAAERASKRAALAERAKLPPEIVLRGPRTQADVAGEMQRIVDTAGDGITDDEIRNVAAWHAANDKALANVRAAHHAECDRVLAIAAPYVKGRVTPAVWVDIHFDAQIEDDGCGNEHVLLSLHMIGGMICTRELDLGDGESIVQEETCNLLRLAKLL